MVPNDLKKKAPAKKGRPSAEERLRRRLEGLEPVRKLPTQEELARAYNALLAALRGA